MKTEHWIMLGVGGVVLYFMYKKSQLGEVQLGAGWRRPKRAYVPGTAKAMPPPVREKPPSPVVPGPITGGSIYEPVKGLSAGDSTYVTSTTQFVERQRYGRPWEWVKVPIQIYTAGPKKAAQDAVDYALQKWGWPLRPIRGLSLDPASFSRVVRTAVDWISSNVPSGLVKNPERDIRNELAGRMIKS